MMPPDPDDKYLIQPSYEPNVEAVTTAIVGSIETWVSETRAEWDAAENPTIIDWATRLLRAIEDLADRPDLDTRDVANGFAHFMATALIVIRAGAADGAMLDNTLRNYRYELTGREG